MFKHVKKYIKFERTKSLRISFTARAWYALWMCSPRLQSGKLNSWCLSLCAGSISWGSPSEPTVSHTPTHLVEISADNYSNNDPTHLIVKPFFPNVARLCPSESGLRQGAKKASRLILSAIINLRTSFLRQRDRKVTACIVFLAYPQFLKAEEYRPEVVHVLTCKNTNCSLDSYNSFVNSLSLHPTLGWTHYEHGNHTSCVCALALRCNSATQVCTALRLLHSPLKTQTEISAITISTVPLSPENILSLASSPGMKLLKASEICISTASIITVETLTGQ